MEPGNLSGILVDCHIYTNHIENAKVQLEREPKELPKIELTHDKFFDWTHEDTTFLNYEHHPTLKFEIAV